MNILKSFTYGAFYKPDYSPGFEESAGSARPTGLRDHSNKGLKCLETG
jgi:hypothetical protein